MLNTTSSLYKAQRDFLKDYQALTEQLQTDLMREIEAVQRDEVIPVTQSDSLMRRLEAVVIALFLGSNSPYKRLIDQYAVVLQGIVVQAHRDYLQRKLEPEIVTWLDGATSLGDSGYTPFVDERGYDLDTRIYAVGLILVQKLRKYLLYHILKGTPTRTIDRQLTSLLSPNRVIPDNILPRNVDMSFEPSRLGRGELIRTYTEITFAAALFNPITQGMEWALSPRHPKRDICDGLATLGVSGERLREHYRIEDAPRVVVDSHIQCLCANFPPDTVDQEALSALDVAYLRGELPPMTPLSTSFLTWYYM